MFSYFTVYKKTKIHLPVQVRNELILVVTHTGPEMRDSHVCLFGPAEIGLRDEHMAHGQHAQAAQLLGRVEHDRRETTGHFRVETDLDTGLDLVLTLDQKVQEFLGVHDRLSEIGHQTNEGCVPLVHNLNDSWKIFMNKLYM